MESHGDDLRRWRIAGGAAAIALAAIATLGTTSAAFTATAPVTGLIESGRVELSAGGVSSLTFGGADLAAIGVDIVTIGQYLRPTTHHLPVARWVEPDIFEMYKRVGEELGIGHVESSPLTRSSYHARESAEHVVDTPVSVTIGVR